MDAGDHLFRGTSHLYRLLVAWADLVVRDCCGLCRPSCHSAPTESPRAVIQQFVGNWILAVACLSCFGRHFWHVTSAGASRIRLGRTPVHTQVASLAKAQGPTWGIKHFKSPGSPRVPGFICWIVLPALTGSLSLKLRPGYEGRWKFYRKAPRHTR